MTKIWHWPIACCEADRHPAGAADALPAEGRSRAQKRGQRMGRKTEIDRAAAGRGPKAAGRVLGVTDRELSVEARVAGVALAPIEEVFKHRAQLLALLGQ